MDKNELRRKYIEIRNNIEKKEEKSYIIQNEIIKTDAYKKAQVVALYKSLASEVNTDYLIEHSLNLKKIVCLPKVEGEDINFYQINNSKEKEDIGIAFFSKKAMSYNPSNNLLKSNLKLSGEKSYKKFESKNLSNIRHSFLPNK